MEALEQIHERGYSTDEEEYDGIFLHWSPIFDNIGIPVGAISNT